MENQSPNSVLYVVATPIGNLGDLSERAKNILSEADLIAAEDTRHTASLLSKLKLPSKKLVSYYDQIEDKRSDELVKQMLSEQLHVALVSDAGTPCISDPGYRLVAKAKEVGITVVPIPGPCAFVSLVASAGLPCHRFAFIGFLPSKRSSLEREISTWKNLHMPVVCYESPRRLQASLSLVAAHYPTSLVAIGRELTKLHEEVISLKIDEAMSWADGHKNLKGELVMMIDPSLPKASPSELTAQIKRDAQELWNREPQLSHKDLLQRFSDEGLGKKDLYRLLLELEIPDENRKK